MPLPVILPRLSALISAKEIFVPQAVTVPKLFVAFASEISPAAVRLAVPPTVIASDTDNADAVEFNVRLVAFIEPNEILLAVIFMLVRAVPAPTAPFNATEPAPALIVKDDKIGDGLITWPSTRTALPLLKSVRAPFTKRLPVKVCVPLVETVPVRFDVPETLRLVRLLIDPLETKLPVIVRALPPPSVVPVIWIEEPVSVRLPPLEIKFPV